MKIKYHAIYQHLRDKLNYEISQDGVYYTQECLEEVLDLLVEDLQREFEEENKKRILHGLTPRKRISYIIFHRVLQKLYKYVSDSRCGETGASNSNTVLSEESKCLT